MPRSARIAASARTAGFYFTNPFAVKKKVTLRIFNFNSETLKVNDALGNPIEIAAGWIQRRGLRVLLPRHQFCHKLGFSVSSFWVEFSSSITGLSSVLNP
jgi:hypothetical protein